MAPVTEADRKSMSGWEADGGPRTTALWRSSWWLSDVVPEAHVCSCIFEFGVDSRRSSPELNQRRAGLGGLIAFRYCSALHANRSTLPPLCL